ncbi:RNA polymerase sigma factor [Patescibacteria group bacterium]
MTIKTNQEEFTQIIYRQYQRRLRNFIARKIALTEDVEEILQETLVVASEACTRFKGRSSVFTWLCAIARHEIADHYRKKKIKKFFFSRFPWLEELVGQALGPEQILLRQEFEGKVKWTLAELSEGYSEVLRLKYYEGLSVKEIAFRLNETTKAVESRLFRARKAFAKAFSTDDA